MLTKGLVRASKSERVSQPVMVKKVRDNGNKGNYDDGINVVSFSCRNAQ
jgi:hypothetical protein